MSFGFFLNQLNIEERKSFQKLVGLCKKKIKKERSIKYLEIIMNRSMQENRKSNFNFLIFFEKITFLDLVFC